MILWGGLALGKAGLCAALAWRRFFRRMPYFFAWSLAMLACEALQIAAYRSGGYKAYYSVYWLTAPIGYLLQFAVLFEAVNRVLRRTGKKGELGASARRMSWTIYVGMLLAAAGSAIFSAHTASVVAQHLAQTGHAMTAAQVSEAELSTVVISLQRSTLAAWLSALLVCAVYASWAGLVWPRFTLCAVVGMASWNAAGFINSSFCTLFGIRHQQWLGWIEMGASDIVLLAWIACFALRSHQLQPSVELEAAKEQIRRFAEESGFPLKAATNE